MHDDGARGGRSSRGWVRLAYGAVIGAVAAAALGYGLSVAFSTAGLALVAPSEGAGRDSGLFFARSGLNYLAIHHIRIVGGGLPGNPANVALSILWPLTIWAVIPAAALMVGGYVSRRLSGAASPAWFASGALVAIPYIIFLLVASIFFVVPSTAVKLPEISGTGIAPESVPALLRAAADGTVLNGILFGIIFGGLGALGGFRAIWNGLFRRDAFWPSWARGAMISVIAGQLVFFVLVFVLAFLAPRLGFGGGISNPSPSEAGTLSEAGEMMRSWVTVSPAVSGNIHYFSHGVTLAGRITSKVGIPEARSNVQVFRAGIIKGITYEGESKPVARWLYLLVLAPAIALAYGGYIAARTGNEQNARFALAAKFAVFYALLLTALVPLYTLALRTAIMTGEITTRTAAMVGPSAAQTFGLSLVIAFVFGYMGVKIHRRDANT